MHRTLDFCPDQPAKESDTLTKAKEWLSRDRPRFFDQVGHQTTNLSIENKYFFNR